ncbi:MAG: hypothetical protein M3229_04180 [Actinomycetota bacterium]|nr:hypothetical protein [Actinomycetota bacterium]
MKRVVPLALLALVVAVPAGGADGCFGPCNGASVNPPGTTVLAVRPRGDGGPLVAYDTRTGKRRYTLPAGIPSADGRSYSTARPRGRWTTLQTFDTRTGALIRRWRVASAGWLTAVSAQGRWLALNHYRAKPRPGRTTITLLHARSGKVARTLRLPGAFDVDTISADGERLFLVQYLNGAHGRYQIRVFDLENGRLRREPIKGADEGAVMTGYGTHAVGSPDGRWLFTLYVNTARSLAFIHALNVETARPRCIFLPSRPRAWDAMTRYSLTLAPDGRHVYAANPVLGLVADVDLSKMRVVRTVEFQPERAAARRLPTRTNAAISPDGRTLYFTGARSVWAYDAAAARVRGPYAAGRPVIGLAWTGKRVHALGADRRLLAFDARTGRLLSRR